MSNHAYVMIAFICMSSCGFALIRQWSYRYIHDMSLFGLFLYNFDADTISSYLVCISIPISVSLGSCMYNPDAVMIVIHIGFGFFFILDQFIIYDPCSCNIYAYDIPSQFPISKSIWVIMASFMASMLDYICIFLISVTIPYGSVHGDLFWLYSHPVPWM